MKYKFLLSVVIPTRNRAFYAKEAVKQVLSFNDSRIQVVVQDNGDDISLSEELGEVIDNPQVKYNYSSEILSFVENFNKAVELAEGEYICVIGDDDGITSMMMEAVQCAKEHDIDAIRPGLNAVYFWPNSDVGKGKKDDGLLIVTKMDHKVKSFYPKAAVLGLLKNGGLNYLDFDLVKLYHGVVRKKYLDKVKELTGSYFAGLTPDIYASVALSLVVTNGVKVNFPLTISGICNRSGSADSATGRHTGKLEDAPHFKGHTLYEWANLVPSFYSVETIWADSALAAIASLAPGLLNEFNVLKLDKECLVTYPQFSEIIIEHAERVKGVNLTRKGLIPSIIHRIIKFGFRVRRYLLNPRTRYPDIKTLYDAEKYVRLHLDRNGISGKNFHQNLDKVNISLGRERL